MAETTIEWTRPPGRDGTPRKGYTFNPWWGCDEVSPACDNCYARIHANRFHWDVWNDKARRFFDDHNQGEPHWKRVEVWNRQAQEHNEVRLVFTASMGDIFEINPFPETARRQAQARARLGQLIRDTPNLIYLMLTKRPENWLGCLGEMGLLDNNPPRNFWVGATIENAGQLERRAITLWQMVRHHTALRDRIFGSYEPALGPIANNLDSWQETARIFSWIVMGGESGSAKTIRKPEEQWFNDVVQVCQDRDVPVLMKQWGNWGPPQTGRGDLVYYQSKHDAGRLLKGRTWSQWPKEMLA